MSAILHLILRPNSARGAARKQIAHDAIGCARSFFAIVLIAFTTPCFAGIDIEIAGVTETLERNVRTFLSMSRYASRDDLDAETVARLGRRIPPEVRKALEPLGYYSASATYSLTQNDKQWTVQIVIDSGRAVRITQSQVEITGPGANDSGLQSVLKRADLHPGARLDHGVYESVKSELLRTANNNGYLDAKWIRNEMIVDPTERRGSVYLVLDTGEQYRFGVITLTQPVLREDIARRMLRMKTGDPYRLDAVLESQYLFDDSQYFRAVEFEPGEPNRETHEVPLAIRAEKNKRNRYSISGGYGTDTNIRGKLTWDNRYINRRGHRSQVQLTGSGVLKEASATYIVPVQDVALEKVEFNALAKEEELGDLVTRTAQLSTGLTQVLSTWQRVLFLRLSNETTEALNSAEDQATAASTPTGKKFYVIPGISFATLPPSLLQRQTRNWSLYSELTGSPETLGSDATFLQLRANAEWVRNIAPRWRVRLRGQFGVTWSDDFESVPVSNRFFAGGDNSVRGFGLNELSPVVVQVLDPGPPPITTEVRVGGANLLVGSIELERDLPKIFGVDNLSAAVFFDAGNAFDEFDDFTIEYSAGIGARYRLVGIASIGVDIAQALSDLDRSPRFHLSLNTLL